MTERKKTFQKGMVDVGEKPITQRVAIAQSTITMSPEAFAALVHGDSPKGDVLETAKVAGILAAKHTPSIIPMCHPLELNKVQLTPTPEKKSCSVVIQCEVKYAGKTGVEMEALTAVSVAALTVYDMMKWADKSMVISQVQLLHKSGGKSGNYHRKGK